MFTYVTYHFNKTSMVFKALSYPIANKYCCGLPTNNPQFILHVYVSVCLAVN